MSDIWNYSYPARGFADVSHLLSVWLLESGPTRPLGEPRAHSNKMYLFFFKKTIIQIKYANNNF